MPTLEELRETRIQKLEALKTAGENPYPTSIRRDYLVKTAFGKFWTWRLTKKEFSLTGRIKSIRVHGQAVFFDLEDGSGKIQILISATSRKLKVLFLKLNKEKKRFELKR